MGKEFEFLSRRGRSSWPIISILFHPGVLTPSQNDTLLIFAILLMPIALHCIVNWQRTIQTRDRGRFWYLLWWVTSNIVRRGLVTLIETRILCQEPGRHSSMLRCILLCCEEAPRLVGSRDLDCQSNKEHFADCVVSSNNKLEPGVHR